MDESKVSERSLGDPRSMKESAEVEMWVAALLFHIRSIIHWIMGK